MVTTTSSRYHLLPGRGRRGRSSLASFRSDLRVHLPDRLVGHHDPAGSMSSETSRHESANLSYSYTAWLITSAGYRTPRTMPQ